MRKRYRTPTAKPGEIKIAYGLADHNDVPDLCVAWGPGTQKPDARYLMNAFDAKRMRRDFPSGEIVFDNSVIEELEARGYDITTLKFSVQRKEPPHA